MPFPSLNKVTNYKTSLCLGINTCFWFDPSFTHSLKSLKHEHCMTLMFIFNWVQVICGWSFINSNSHFKCGTLASLQTGYSMTVIAFNYYTSYSIFLFMNVCLSGAISQHFIISRGSLLNIQFLDWRRFINWSKNHQKN